MDGHRRLARTREVVGAVVREVRAENVTFMAGSIAYHAFVSLLPFLLLVLFLVTQLGGPDLAQRLVEAIVANLTPGTDGTGPDVARQFVDLLVRAATNATASTGLSVVSAVALVWGALRIFRGLDQAFSDIYESHAANTFLDQVRDAAVVFLALGLALFAVSAAEELLGVPSLGALDAVVRPLLSVVSIAAALYPMYYVFPDEAVSLREVIPGALVAGAGWTALSYAFGLYTRLSSSSEYGIVGVVILLITWLYFGGLVLLVGASVNAVLAGRSTDVDDIAWGRPAGTDAAHNDADFVGPLRTLAGADLSGEVRIVAGDAAVTLPPPAAADVDVSTVDRPRWLGGDRETGRVVLRWDDRSE